MKPFRLAGVAETLETEFAARMEEKRLEFRVNNSADEVVMGDRNLILRIGSNLLSNALKFTERGGVTLTALYAGGKFTLAVEDTGGGIDKDKREQIFKPFERLSNAATQDGFGLGPLIVKKPCGTDGGQHIGREHTEHGQPLQRGAAAAAPGGESR